MAQPFVPGPAHVFLVYRSNPYYFGLTARGCDIDITTRLGDYHVDIAGEEPADHYLAGRKAVVTTEFTRWDQITYELAAASPAGGVGIEDPGDIGTLLGFEDQAVQLLIVFPYSLKAAYAVQPAGYRFVKAYLDREGLPERGAKPARLRLTWRCWRSLDMSIQSVFGPGRLTLYDYDVSAANLALIT